MRAALLLTVMAIVAACDSAVKVGDLESEPEAGPPGPIVPEADSGDVTPAIFSWRQHAPTVPCTIYALAEQASNNVFLGCNGGRLYRFDGVKARVDLETDDSAVISLIWIAPNGEVFAGAQLDPDPDRQKTQLHRFDGTTWSKFGSATRRIVSLAGVDELWVATETEILKREGNDLVSKFQTSAGFFRGCAFGAPDKGWCVGTNGLAVEWDGATWTPIPSANVPWSTEAEVFGVEWDSFSKVPTFFYGEPISQSDGDHSCRIGRLGKTYQANVPCFPSFRVARKRTGQAIANGKLRFLISVSDSGGPLVYDLPTDSVTSMCAPVIAYASGNANTRGGGLWGLLGTIIGTGGNQLALSSFGGVASSSVEFRVLSVASDGAAWARVEDNTACGTISDRIVRFDEDKREWEPIPGPQGALSGRSLAAVSKDRAYTIDEFDDRLLIAAAGGWTEGPVLEDPWSLYAANADDIWVGGRRENFGHADEKTYTSKNPIGRQRQAEQTLAVGSDVWFVQLGTGVDDTHQHLIHFDGKDVTDEDLGIMRLGSEVQLSALPNDPSHVYRSGAPAAAWDGKTWKPLGFYANGVWARAADEVYFIESGDIYRWNGTKKTRVFHGQIPISWIGGSPNRGFAVGPGGLTLEFAAWPDEQR